MKRIAIFFVLLATAAAEAQAGKVSPGQKFVLPEGAELIRLKLRPAAVPVPVFKYRLLPELRDVKPGNAALLYYRSFSPEWQSVRRQPQISKPFDAWTEDTRKAPPKEIEWVTKSPMFKELDLAARRSYVDWEMTDRLRQDGISFLLPDMQGFRWSIAWLAARARFEAQAGNFDKAIYTLQTGYKLGRDVGDAPTLIQTLVGAAILQVMLQQTEEIVQLPGAPNLYWALTDLPRPCLSLRKPYQGERLFVDTMFPGVREMLADVKVKPLSPGQVDSMLERFLKDLSGLVGSSGIEERLAIAVLAARAHPEAKRFLLSRGLSKEQVEALPVLQAFVLLEVHNYDRLNDELIRVGNLPYPQANVIARAAEAKLKEAKANAVPGTTLATLLIPAVQKVQQSVARADRRIAALRIIEALRIYLAAHDGKLPASLDAISEVPIPLDPLTANPFQYSVEKDRAILYGPAPAGETPYSNNVLMYELTVNQR